MNETSTKTSKSPLAGSPKSIAISRKKLLTFIAIFIVVGLTVRVFTQASQSGPPPGYSLMWQDEFNGTSLDLSKWNYFLGQGTASNINYTKDAVSVANGSLDLTTYTENGIHQSGHIQSDNKYQPKYGYLEASINFAYPDNVGGAFWLFHPLVNTYGDPWNHGVEIDVVEYAKRDWQQKDISNQAISSLNWGQYGPDWDNHPSTGSTLRGSGLASGTHTYAVEWTPTTLKFYIDGQYQYQINDSTVAPVARRDLYLILDQYPTGGAVNYGSKSTSTAKMKVDYVRVYQLNSQPPAPTNLRVSGGSGSAVLNWSLAANATNYNIKRSTGGAYTTIASTTNLSYTDTTARAGTNYYYAVSAVNPSGESSISVPVLVTPNLAVRKPIAASSSLKPAVNATDGNATSFWESVWNTDPQWAYVDLQAITPIQKVTLNWELAYAKAYEVQISNDAVNWTKVYTTTTGDGGVDEIAFPQQNARYVRMYGTQRAHPYSNPSVFGYAIKEFEVYSNPNLALRKPVTVSSVRQPAVNATDGNATSFWESVWNTDPQWAYVDLQAITPIQKVTLNWELAYAKAYEVQISNDAVNWTKVYTTTTGDGGVDEIAFPQQNARYVRMYGTQRAHPYSNPSVFGYAIKEFEVYSNISLPTPTNLNSFPANQSVKLSWTPAPGVDNYTVKRATSSGGPYTSVATVSNNSYTDTSLINGTTYYHIVTPTNSSGASNETVTTARANLALWQQAYASSKLNTDTQPFKAVDGTPSSLNGITSTWHSAFSDNQWLSIDLRTNYLINQVVINWDYAYAKSFDVQVSKDSVNWTSVYSTTTGSGGVSDVKFDQVDARYIRMLGKQRGTTFGYAIKEFEVYSNPNLALRKPVTVSSVRQPAVNATDGNATSFWESVWNTDPQWAYVDLQAITPIQKVTLNWELAYAKAYEVQISNDAVNWTKVYTTTTGDGGVDEIAFPQQNARYVRMYGTQRAHPYSNPSVFGYAIKEFEVYSHKSSP